MPYKLIYDESHGNNLESKLSAPVERGDNAQIVIELKT